MSPSRKHRGVEVCVTVLCVPASGLVGGEWSFCVSSIFLRRPPHVVALVKICDESSEEVLRRRSGDHLSILDPTGYLGILVDMDGVTQGDAVVFDSGISLTTLGLVSPTGPGFLGRWFLLV